jgi:hypothetical protein
MFIPDPDFFHPGSWGQKPTDPGSRIRDTASYVTLQRVCTSLGSTLAASTTGPGSNLGRGKLTSDEENMYRVPVYQHRQLTINEQMSRCFINFITFDNERLPAPKAFNLLKQNLFTQQSLWLDGFSVLYRYTEYVRTHLKSTVTTGTLYLVELLRNWPTVCPR